jgi:hypothetical protein
LTLQNPEEGILAKFKLEESDGVKWLHGTVVWEKTGRVFGIQSFKGKVRTSEPGFQCHTLGANFDPPVVKLAPRGKICPLGVKILCSPLNYSKL